MKYWFTSDTHYFHDNIIKHTHRPFKNVEEMNETMIKNYNSLVKPEDVTYFLGDFAWKNHKQILKRLNGHIIFILGNHDNHTALKTNVVKAEILLGGKEMLLVHNPAHVEEGFRYNLVGHVHKLWKKKVTKKGTVMLNVGVDQHNFFPVSLKQVLKELEGKIK